MNNFENYIIEFSSRSRHHSKLVNVIVPELIKFNKQGSGILSSISNTEGIIELDDKFQLIKKGDILRFYRYEDLLN